jgi:hypothetical protein
MMDEVMTLQMTTGRWTAAFVAVGFAGAAAFYGPYIGFSTQTSWVCPLCPHVISVGGTAFGNFLRLTIGGGILNAGIFAAAGWIILTVVRDMRQRLRISK